MWDSYFFNWNIELNAMTLLLNSHNKSAKFKSINKASELIKLWKLHKESYTQKKIIKLVLNSVHSNLPKLKINIKIKLFLAARNTWINYS